jgi:hypothetical protein
MVKNFTSEHLVSFIYRETSATENAHLNAALSQDASLRAEYQEMQEGFQALPKAQFRPSNRAIQNILKYSQESTVLI